MGDVTIAEAISGLVVLAGLLLSGWALVDDVWDVINVKRFGEVGGPRWVAANERLGINFWSLVGWLCALGLLGIAVYLPPREDAALNELAQAGGWLRLGILVSMLIAQVSQRVGRSALRRLPLAAWERMLASMVDGLGPEQQVAIKTRLLAATTAGRELGHAVANELAPAVGLIDLVLETAVLTAQQRADLEEAQAHVVGVAGRASRLHAEIKRAGGVA